mmetsp:Transcript_106440/g.206090  ORF Transcript_106440/g.206090 Transcript_106440/m.206090 type:complete len:369 (+) Transcript_106440:83-1189(+)
MAFMALSGVLRLLLLVPCAGAELATVYDGLMPQDLVKELFYKLDSVERTLMGVPGSPEHELYQQYGAERWFKVPIDKTYATNGTDLMASLTQFVLDTVPEVQGVPVQFVKYVVHIKPQSQPLQFHFDVAEDQPSGRIVFPALSVVLFLTKEPEAHLLMLPNENSCGAGPMERLQPDGQGDVASTPPNVPLSWACPKTTIRAPSLRPEQLQRGELIQPLRGRIAVMRGNTLHGIIPGTDRRSERRVLTWTIYTSKYSARPKQDLPLEGRDRVAVSPALAKMLPFHLARAPKPPREANWTRSIDASAVSAKRVRLKSPGVPSWTYINIPLPKPDDLAQCMQGEDAGVCAVHFDEPLLPEFPRVKSASQEL